MAGGGLFDMAQLCGADDGMYAALQGAYTPGVDLLGAVDELLHATYVPFGHLYSGGGLWLLRRVYKADADGHVFEESCVAAYGYMLLVALSSR